jgi:hypothetical protein
VAVLVVLAVLTLDMSGSAPRTAGSDHYAPLIYLAPVGASTSVCQPLYGLPDDAARVRMTVGGAGKRIPSLTLRFLSPSRAVLAEGHLGAGAREGRVELPLRRTGARGVSSEACIVVGSPSGPVSFAGEGVPPSPLSERVNGQTVASRLALFYVRAGSESWWQLLPTLDERFGVGKASIFGSWLLPFCAVALLAVWIGTLRLLAHRLR